MTSTVDPLLLFAVTAILVGLGLIILPFYMSHRAATLRQAVADEIELATQRVYLEDQGLQRGNYVPLETVYEVMDVADREPRQRAIGPR